MSQREGPVLPSYGSYLQLPTLLACQNPPDYRHLQHEEEGWEKTRPRAHHDELLFIVVHQVFELWFKVILEEMRQARDLLGRRSSGPPRDVVPEEAIPKVVAALQRINEVLQVGTQQWRVMETMNPTAFLEFRDLIIPASGFQSVQFRELEILAGLPESLRVDFEGTPYETNLSPEEVLRLDAVRREMTLKEALFDWLGRTPIEEAFPDFQEAYIAAFKTHIETQRGLQELNPHLAESQKAAALARLDRQVAEAAAYLRGTDETTRRAHQAFLFITCYREAPLLRWPSLLLDALIEFEQGFRIFRFRHARMVERMIGARTGTGGSPGVAYLDHTTQRYRIFGDLLEARTFLLPVSALPALPRAGRFGFRRAEP
jgi:tryptophan 2,3-dioxygenase